MAALTREQYFDAALDVEIKRAQRAQGPMSLVLVDLDGFKEMNDTYGHRRGDEILRAVAEKLRPMLRSTDVIARVGGDEFALILPEKNRDDALKVIERMRRDAVHNFEGHELTWSAGIACFEHRKTLFRFASSTASHASSVQVSTGPSPRLASVVGHAQIRAPAAARRSNSWPSACVAWTTVVRGPRQPQASISSIGRRPCSARHSSISRGCSSAWACSGKSCSEA